MNQINVSLIGDSNTGKKTFLNLLRENQESDISSSTYFPVMIKNDNQNNYNFFLTSSNIRKINQTLQKVMISDVLVFFFNLVEEENEIFSSFSSKEEKEEIKQTCQSEKYQSILEPILECVFNLNFEKRIIIILNKIDHPQVDYSQEITNKATQYFKKLLSQYYLDLSSVYIVQASALKNQNIVSHHEGCKGFFFQILLQIGASITNKRPTNIEQHLPLRISALKIHKIIGTGIVVQGIVLSSEIKEKDEVLILPSRKRTKVKQLQIYNQRVKSAKKSQIVGINLKGINLKDIKKGYTLVKLDEWKNQQEEVNGMLLRANFIYTFNGIYPGFQLNLIGLNMKIPCFVQNIVSKADFKNNQGDKNKEDDQIAEAGNVCLMDIAIMKKYFMEKFEDFPRLGKFVIVEQNVVLGFAEILEFKKYNLN